MKVLFITSYFYPDENTAVNVAYKYIKEIAKEHEVDIFTLYKEKAKDNTGSYDGLNVFYSGKKSFMEDIYLKLHRGMIRYPDESLKSYLVKKYFLRVMPVKAYVKRKDSNIRYLLKVLKDNKYSAVISVSAPTRTHLLVNAVYKELKRKNIKWYMLIEDPSSEYAGLKKEREYYRRLEADLYRKADKIMVFSQIVDNKNDILNDFPEKIVRVDYPNFSLKECPHKDLGLDKDKIHFLYSGSFFDIRIRNPEYCFKLIKEMDSEKYHFHFVVSHWDKTTLTLKEKYLDECENVTFYDRMPIEDCFAFMDNADYLLNISNLATNQVPSKIFDYVGTGKPIVNIYLNDNDPSLDILKDYPLSINIAEKKSLEENAKLLDEFCLKNKGKRTDPETLKALFKKCTAEEAVKPILQLLDEQK